MRSMDNPATYFHMGFIDISIPNLVTIGLMLLVFALAVVVPMPATNDHDSREDA